jgi:hypothetical protein
MYYRVAIRQNTSPTWQWKSTTISSLTALFQFLRRYDKLAQDRLRVFSSPCIEEMDKQLGRENNGLDSCSVTAAQFRQEHMMGARPAAAITATSSHEGSNGTYPAGESFPASRTSTAGVASQAVSRGDFWNLMTLAKS